MDRIEIGKLSVVYDVRRLGLADAPMVYAFCRANTRYYAYCGAEVTLELAVHIGDGQGQPSVHPFLAEKRLPSGAGAAAGRRRYSGGGETSDGVNRPAPSANYKPPADGRGLIVYSALSMVPPPSTSSPSYSTTACPAVTARWGWSNTTRTPPSSSG